MNAGLVFLSGLVVGVICYLMMWRAGPVALGISSTLFFVLIRWAVGLTRVRLLVFEETQAQKKEDEKAVV